MYCISYLFFPSPIIQIEAKSTIQYVQCCLKKIIRKRINILLLFVQFPDLFLS